MKDNPRWHPASKIFPLMSDPELKELAEDIDANGQQNPVTMLEGLVLDGRTRILALKKAGAQPRTVEAPEIARGKPSSMGSSHRTSRGVSSPVARQPLWQSAPYPPSRRTRRDARERADVQPTERPKSLITCYEQDGDPIAR
jgi:hypothetical protein